MKTPREEELEGAIRNAVTQKGDDLCWLDVMRDLARLVGIEFNAELLPKEVFLKNCERFHASLMDGDQYERKLVLIARGHPEADGRSPKVGEQAFILKFPLEREWELELKIGAEEARAFRAMVLDYEMDEAQERTGTTRTMLYICNACRIRDDRMETNLRTRRRTSPLHSAGYLRRKRDRRESRSGVGAQSDPDRTEPRVLQID